MKLDAAAVLLAALVCTQAQSQAPQSGIDKLGWLSGCWQAADGSSEYWTAQTGGSMFGIGITLREGKLRSHEFMQIHSAPDGKLLFTAHPSGQSSATFKEQLLSDTEVVFAKPEHDFPQRVIYKRLDDKRLQARIEGEKNGKLRGIDFPLQKTSCDKH